MNAIDVILSDDELDTLSEAGAVIVCTSDCCNHYSPTYSPSTPCSTLRVITDIVAAHVEADRLALAADRDHWKDHAEEAGRGFALVCRNYARKSAQVAKVKSAVGAEWFNGNISGEAADRISAVLLDGEVSS